MMLSRRRMCLARRTRRELDNWLRQRVVAEEGGLKLVKLPPWYLVMRETRRGFLAPLAKHLSTFEDAKVQAQRLLQQPATGSLPADGNPFSKFEILDRQIPGPP